MLLIVNRFASDDDSTISLISVDDVFECFGLEDEYRAYKKIGETRIPAGRYKVGVRIIGGFHGKYGGKFPDFHKGMLQVMNVPGFDYILIHIGNTDDDTAGCLLTGTGCYSQKGNMSVQASTVAYKKLYKKIIAAALHDELWIEYIDNDI